MEKQIVIQVIGTSSLTWNYRIYIEKSSNNQLKTLRSDKMAFDYKKEYKEFYMPKNKPSIVDVPKMNYIAVRGKGNP